MGRLFPERQKICRAAFRQCRSGHGLRLRAHDHIPFFLGIAALAQEESNLLITPPWRDRPLDLIAGFSNLYGRRHFGVTRKLPKAARVRIVCVVWRAFLSTFGPNASLNCP